VNKEEAKQILLLYRPGTADAEDPDTAAALALAKTDPELGRWLVEHSARQSALREKFRQIPVLAGLKEQIISEEAAKGRAMSRRQKIQAALAVAAIIISLAALGIFLLPHRTPNVSALSEYQNQMAYYALSGYSMDLTTDDSRQIQAYLAGKQAPSDYALPASLQNVAVTGCAIENWQNSKASMICFRTEKSLPAGQKADLWLFVVDRTTVKDISDIPQPQFAKVGALMTATWTQGGNLYVLGIQGDENTIKKYL
jgi:hypothetical protein